MNIEERLAGLVQRLRDAGVNALVMGGHAVRHYGVGRNTNDFDFLIEPMPTDELRRRLLDGVFPEIVREGPSWRPNEFVRFEIGRLPDGREEWLEFWLHNHLLPDFRALHARHERAEVGGAAVGYLAITDLMRSKETERESDWHDIALLEEILDARNFARASDAGSVVAFLAGLRSRRGFDRARAAGFLDDRAAVESALARSVHPVTVAFLLPAAPDAAPPPHVAIDADRVRSLRAVRLAEAKHLGLVEVVRRAYKRRAVDADRAEKQARLGRGR